MHFIYLFILITSLFSVISCTSTLKDDKVKEKSSFSAGFYQEQHRPQFHFSPQEEWMNDPNGMVFYEGEYHLFYQYYPDSNVWGPMHWGHAVSDDLLHWEHLPIALYPDPLGYIFSGSAVVDWNNTSGFGENGLPPLIAIFTHHDPEGEAEGKNDYQAQSIAYSNDKGRTWTKYEGNPVVPNPGIKDFRDPKVIWDKTFEKWFMVFAAYDHVKFYSSPDLKKWTHLSDFGKEWGCHGGVWECPDFFPMPVQGSEKIKWVLLLSINPGGPNGGSATQYFIGDFDGTLFNLDKNFATMLGKGSEKGIWLDYGRDNYAGVTWSDIPESDGRRLFMGWMSNWNYAKLVPTEVWRSAMTIPRELKLKQFEEGSYLATTPVQELTQLRLDSFSLKDIVFEGEYVLSDQVPFPPSQMELVLDIELTRQDQTFSIELSNEKNEKYLLTYDHSIHTFYSDRRQSGKKAFSTIFANKMHEGPRLKHENDLKMHLFFDVASVELFADEGSTVLTDIFFPNEDYSMLSLKGNNGQVKIRKATFFQLKSIW